MLKLYKKTMTGLQYWEAWSVEQELILHWGKVGERGKSRTVPLNGEDQSTAIRREAKNPRKRGYRKIPTGRLVRIVIQYRIDGMGTTEDLDKRIQVQNLMDDRLGWLGLGHCDGGDIGSGTINVFCLVVDGSIAIPHVIDELRSADLLHGAAITITSDAGDSIVWPKPM